MGEKKATLFPARKQTTQDKKEADNWAQVWSATQSIDEFNKRDQQIYWLHMQVDEHRICGALRENLEAVWSPENILFLC